MEKQTVIIVGVGTVAAAVVGGLGWKALGARKKAKEQIQLERKANLVQQAAQRQMAVAEQVAAVMPTAPVTVVEKELTPENLRASGDSVLSAIADMMVESEAEVVITESVVEESQVLQRASGDGTLPARPTLSIVKNDRVETVRGSTGEPIVSVSRARVPEQVQPDQTPMFWSSFLSKVRRPDVVILTSKDFDTKKEELAKGYHKCTVDGVAGVLHVTKSNVSAVMHLGGDTFVGISTSASRFGRKGLGQLSFDQAKNFLNGR